MICPRCKKEFKEFICTEFVCTYIDVPELNFSITPIQQFNGKTYVEIVKQVGEENIATHDELQKLRNIAFKSNWKKYSFMKEFCAFVPNPDEVSKANNYVAVFDAVSDRAGLYCGRDPTYTDSGLGVILVRRGRKIKKVRK